MSALGEAGADLRSPPARRRGGEGAAGAARQASDSLSPTTSPERGGANAADYVETPARRAWRRLVRRRGAMVGLAVIILVILVALFAPLVAPYDPAAQSWSAVRKAPSAAYWLGTDEVGRDLLSRIIFGARASLSAGVISVGIAIAIGVPLGLLAGYAGGLADGLISRITDAMLACPFLILAIALAAFLGPSLTNAMIAIGVTATPIFVRLTRGQVLSVKAEDYVEAARAVGNPHWRIAFRHILPNVMPALLVQATLTIATAVIAEASLSFLGLGQQPPAPSWGSMLNAAQRFLVNAPWMAVWPGLAIFVTVLSFNLLGDGLRDALDPRSSR
jgi:peptide/nickel transport system permease protein